LHLIEDAVKPLVQLLLSFGVLLYSDLNFNSLRNVNDMSIKQLFDQFLGSAGAQGGLNEVIDKFSGTADKVDKSGFPGGLAGGLAAGGIVSLLLGSKKARKYAGGAAKIGGVALLGGAAYKLYRDWQQKNGEAELPEAPAGDVSENHQLTLIKAMIAAAKADGHIDSDEQAKIFEAVETLALSAEEKATIFDLLNKVISVSEIAQEIETEEQKTEVYLASCLVSDMDHPDERKHLEDLAEALNLPNDLKVSIEEQVQQSLA